MVYESSNMLSLHNLAMFELVVAIIAFVCALKVCLKEDGLDKSNKKSKNLIAYIVVGSLGFMAGLKVKLDVWIMNFTL